MESIILWKVNADIPFIIGDIFISTFHNFLHNQNEGDALLWNPMKQKQ